MATTCAPPDAKLPSGDSTIHMTSHEFEAVRAWEGVAEWLVRRALAARYRAALASDAVAAATRFPRPVVELVLAAAGPLEQDPACASANTTAPTDIARLVVDYAAHPLDLVPAVRASVAAEAARVRSGRRIDGAKGQPVPADRAFLPSLMERTLHLCRILDPGRSSPAAANANATPTDDVDEDEDDGDGDDDGDEDGNAKIAGGKRPGRVWVPEPCETPYDRWQWHLAAATCGAPSHTISAWVRLTSVCRTHRCRRKMDDDGRCGGPCCTTCPRRHERGGDDDDVCTSDSCVARRRIVVIVMPDHTEPIPTSVAEVRACVEADYGPMRTRAQVRRAD